MASIVAHLDRLPLPPFVVEHLSTLLTPTLKYAPAKTTNPFELVDISKSSLWVALAAVVFNPVFWNLVARNEYRNKTLTKVFGSTLMGCYALAIAIFSLGIFRDGLYQRALLEQPSHPFLARPLFTGLAVSLLALGQIFVVTSIYALGITGTYLGDYFGILMKERVTGFPFNVLADPMYVGSTMTFFGTALWYASPAGLVISTLVWIVYFIALKFEGPFTDKIYSTASSASTTASTSKVKTSAPSTPRKSPRKATATSSATSYAAAASEPPAPNGLPSVPVPAPVAAPSVTATPRRRAARQSTVVSSDSGAEANATPARVTRSRSKARMTDEE